VWANELVDPFPFFGRLLNEKMARVEVNISLAFFYSVGMGLSVGLVRYFYHDIS